MDTMPAMSTKTPTLWPPIINDLTEVMTLKEIADIVGASSPGHVWNLKHGVQASVDYELGCRLVDLHRKVKRKLARRVDAPTGARR